MLDALAPAKLNLGLHVLGRREDGYHDLDTVFVRIPWCDHVTVEVADTLSMTCSDPSLPVDERNLCMRAAQVLASAAGQTSGARIHLHKSVPHGSGLGGGSSDAAATLVLLTRLWNLDPGALDLPALAMSLGSDVPFFLGSPIARGEGRGERLAVMEMPPDLARCHIVVGVPPVVVSTARAFGLVRPSDENRIDLVSTIRDLPPALWPGRVMNDFEEPIRREEPLVDLVLETLRAAGADYVSLSGSGSAAFALFSGADRAEAARRTLAPFGCRTWVGQVGDPP